MVTQNKSSSAVVAEGPPDSDEATSTYRCIKHRSMNTKQFIHSQFTNFSNMCKFS